MTVYLASDLGFSESGRQYLYGTLIPAFEKAGMSVLDPWKLTNESIMRNASSCPDYNERVKRWGDANKIIGENNANAIRNCTVLAAVIDGSDVDSGTSAEIGFAAALGKKVYGLRTDFRLASDNEGSKVNLQVEYFINMSGGKITGSIDEIIKSILSGEKE
jgi:nucleoside 2-deoxyribosyltransferase